MGSQRVRHDWAASLSLSLWKPVAYQMPPSMKFPGPVSFRMDWLDLLAVQGTLKSLQHHSTKVSILLHCRWILYCPSDSEERMRYCWSMVAHHPVFYAQINNAVSTAMQSAQCPLSLRNEEAGCVTLTFFALCTPSWWESHHWIELNYQIVSKNVKLHQNY